MTLAAGLTDALAAEGSRNPGPLPLLIVVLLVIATVLLIRNMNGRLKRLPREFPEQPDDRRSTPPGGPGASA